MKPHACARGPGKLQVCPARWIAVGSCSVYLVGAPLIDTSGKLLLVAWVSSRVEGVFSKHLRIAFGCHERHVRGGTSEIEGICWVQLPTKRLGGETGNQTSTWNAWTFAGDPITLVRKLSWTILSAHDLGKLSWGSLLEAFVERSIRKSLEAFPGVLCWKTLQGTTTLRKYLGRILWKFSLTCLAANCLGKISWKSHLENHFEKSCWKLSWNCLGKLSWRIILGTSHGQPSREPSWTNVLQNSLGEICGNICSKTLGNVLGIYFWNCLSVSILETFFGKISWKTLLDISLLDISRKTLFENCLGGTLWKSLLCISLDFFVWISLWEDYLGNLCWRNDLAWKSLLQIFLGIILEKSLIESNESQR